MVDEGNDEGKDEELKQKQKKKAMIEELIIPGAIIISISIIASIFFGRWMSLVVGLLGMLILSFTKVEEGTAKIVELLGKYRKTLMTWTGHYLDTESRVKNGQSHWPLGIYFVGLWPFWRIKKYSFRYSRLIMAGKGFVLKFFEQTLDYVRVREAVYPWAMEGLETAPPERWALSCEWVIAIKIINPKKALIEGPTNWFEAAMSLIEPFLKDWTGGHFYDQLIRLRGKEEDGKDQLLIQLNSDFKNDPLYKKLISWGVEVTWLGLKQVTGPAHLQEAATRQREKEFEAAGRRAEITGEMSGYANAFVEALAKAKNKQPSEISAQIDKNANLQKLFLDFLLEAMSRDQSTRRQALQEIWVRGTSGNSGMDLGTLLLQALTLLKGGGGTGAPQSSKGEKPTKEDEDARLRKKGRRSVGLD